MTLPTIVAGSELTPHAWERITSMWRDLEMVPVSDPQRVIDRCIHQAMELAGASHGMLVIADRPIDDPRDPLGGQRIVEVLTTTDRAHALGPLREYLADARNYLHDPMTIASSSLERKDGVVFCVRDVFARRPDLAAGATAYLESAGIADRMLAGLVFSHSLSALFTLDRLAPAPSFEAPAARAVSTYLAGLSRPVRSVVRAYGYLDATSPLTPRERDVLQHLLVGRVERDIGELLDMTAQTVHSHVKSIYRKFDVSSRAGLLDLWITPRSPV